MSTSAQTRSTTPALTPAPATGVLRGPCLARGRKLCDAGLLQASQASHDLAYLRLDELKRLALTGRVGIAEAIDHRVLIAERRVDRAHWLW